METEIEDVKSQPGILVKRMRIGLSSERALFETPHSVSPKYNSPGLPSTHTAFLSVPRSG
jgi:hypothetical protein